MHTAGNRCHLGGWKGRGCTLREVRTAQMPFSAQRHEVYLKLASNQTDEMQFLED